MWLRRRRGGGFSLMDLCWRVTGRNQVQFCDPTVRPALLMFRIRLNGHMALNCAAARIEHWSKFKLNAKQDINRATHVQLRLLVAGGA